MDEFTGMAFHSAEREVERLERQVDEARQEAAELRRQLAEAQAAIAAVPRPEIAELCDLIDNSTTAISLDCPAGWAVREWLETYEAADLRRQFEQERVEIGMLRRQLQEGEQSALSHAIGQIFYLRRQLAEERMRANAAEFAVAQLLADAADLRRQVEHANRRRDTAIGEANEARAAAADLWRQLEATQAEIAALRIENAAIAAIAAICPTCGGSGAVDSGGFTPWGVGIDATCPTCNGRGKAYTDADDTPHGAEKGDA